MKKEKSTDKKANWRLVGKVKEAHGLRGDLYVLIFSGEAAWQDDLVEFCLASDESLSGKKIFQIEKAKDYKKGLIIKAREVLDRTAAEKLKGQLFFISEELLVAEDGDAIFLDEIEGFEVINKTEPVGPIVGFSTNNIQDLLLVQMPNKQVEIPFVEAFLIEIDYEKRQVILDLPEGLLTLDEDKDSP